MTGTLRPVAPIKAPDVTPSALGEPPALMAQFAETRPPRRAAKGEAA